MSNAETTSDPGSPCIRLCQLDEASGMCLGCKRTMKEITQWASYDDKHKRKILRDLRKR